MHLVGRALADRGHDICVSETMTAEWRDSADIVVGQRVCLPGPTITWQALARRGDTKLVFEVDDDLFNTHHTSKISHAFFSRPEIQDNLRANIEVADLVTVTTEHLAEQLAPLNRNVTVLPNCIPAALLDVNPPHADDKVTIGWAGGHTHAIDWRGPAEHVARFVRRNPNTELHLMGWKPDLLWSLTPPQRRRYTDWIDDVEDLHRSIDFHLGVIPLWDNVFNRSKSDLKFLELAALGIPAVCSNVGPYSISVQHGQTGMLVSRPNEWNSHLRDLAQDECLRKATGESARKWAASRTIEGNAHKWEAVYRE